MKAYLKSNVLALVLLMVLACGTAQAAVPEVLKELPTDAAVVVVSAPLVTLSSKADVFARQIGLPVAPEQPVDLTAMLEAQFGVSGVLDGTRGIGLAIMDLKNAEQSMVAFVPVIDSGRAITALGAVQDPNIAGIWNLPDKGMYLKPVGKRLLVAQNAAVLAGIEQLPKGIKLNSTDERLFSTSDVAAMVNLASVMPEVCQKLAAAMDSEPKMQKYPVLKRVLGKCLDRLSELDRIAIGAGLTANGIKLNIGIQARSGSVLAKHLTAHPAANISALSQLPQSGYVVANTFNINPELIYVPMNAIIDTIAADPNMAAKINAADLAELKTTIRQLYEMGSKGSEAMYSSPVATGSAPAQGGAVPNISAISAIANLEKILPMFQKLCPLISRVSEQAGYPVLMNYKSQAGVVNGLNYDEVSIDISQLPIPAEIMKAVTMQCGGKGIFTYQLCKIDQNRLCTGVGPTGLQGAIDAAKGPAGLNTDPGIVKAAQELSDKANVLAFIDIGKYCQFALSMQTAGAGSNPQMQQMMQMIMGLCSQIKGTAAVSMTVAQGQLAMEVFVPTEAIQSGVAMFMQMMMMGQSPADGNQPSQGQQESTF